MGITINLSQKNGADYVEYSGPIDAEAEVHLEQLKEKLSGNVVFNFKSVSTVNSCGVRSWINFMRDLEQKERTISFEECPGEIVMQINMIPSFKSKATINSVYGTYVGRKRAKCLEGVESGKPVYFHESRPKESSLPQAAPSQEK